jgi:hypothetical protein
MKEFMLLIRNPENHLAHLSPDELKKFLKEVSVYISGLMERGKLKSAQPLTWGGSMISKQKGAWKDGPFNETKEVIVGYYHIIAENIEEAIAIAKGNPEFEYTQTARIEVRPVKMMEETTGFVYPK